ncbi:MAG: hypothetical protein KJP10_10285 [Gammaproteobacteria bacterium]|nr:hypothetical protein [Gammaproteobacteria bacterium]
MRTRHLAGPRRQRGDNGSETTTQNILIAITLLTIVVYIPHILKTRETTYVSPVSN